MPTESEKALALLDDPGWVVIRSAVLEQDVVWTRDADVKVPLRYTVHPRYTYDELKLLTEQRPDPDTMRTIHAAKTIFDGTVVAEGSKPRKPDSKLPVSTLRTPRVLSAPIKPKPEPDPTPAPQLSFI
jgi:GTP-dependent phosphoenolpyruvate carboxykinase